MEDDGVRGTHTGGGWANEHPELGPTDREAWLCFKTGGVPLLEDGGDGGICV